MLGMIGLSSPSRIPSSCRLHAFTPLLFSESSGQGCEGKAVVDWMPEVLFASQVSFRGLNGSMAEQELNLFQFAAAGMAQLGARSP